MYADRKNRIPARLTYREHRTRTVRTWDAICNAALIIAMLLLVFHLAGLTGNLTIFEDGSYLIGWLSGCLPWAICAL